MFKSINTYAEVYGDSYKEQIEHLAQCIMHSVSGQGRFNVLNLEAGIGKSVEAENIIRGNLLLSIKIPHF